MIAHIVESANSSLIQARACVSDQVVNEAIEDPLQSFVEFKFVQRVRIDLFDFAVEELEDGNAFADFLEREQMRLVSIVEVGGVIGDFVGQVDELGFERRALV